MGFRSNWIGGFRIIVCPPLGQRNSPMQRIVHNLAMTVVLYHLLVGCCGHHAHWDISTPTSDDLDAAACCCHEHGDDQRSHGEAPSQKGGGCDGVKCVFVAPQVEGRAHSVDQPPGASLVRLERAFRILPSPSEQAHEFPPPGGVPPIRLHLVLQVLLI